MKGVQAAFVGLILFAVAGQASNTYTFSGPVNGVDEDASVTFGWACVPGATTCTLDILVTNLDSSPTTIGQGILGVSFDLGSLTSLGGTSALRTSGGEAVVNDGNGADVNSISYAMNPVVLTPTNLAPNWSFGYMASASSSSGCQGSAEFCLNGHTGGGQPFDLILGGGPYSGGGSLASHTPDLDGGSSGTYLGVQFQILNVPIIDTTFSVSNVAIDFGTGPDGAGAGCNDTATCGGIIQSTPEPFSIALTGGGLIALALLRRKMLLGRR